MTTRAEPGVRRSPSTPTGQGASHTAPNGTSPGRAIDRHTLLTALWLGALTVGTWPLVVAASGPEAPPVAAVAHVTGMLAGYGVLVLLVLVSRWPALERGVGADVLARWHVGAARVVVGLVVLHAWGAITAWSQLTGAGWPLSAWQVLGMPALPAATAGTLLMLVAAAVSVRAARRRLGHERWHGLHLLVYVAVALSFAHMLAGPDLAGHPILQTGWALAYTHVFGLVLRHRVGTPLRQAVRHRLRVTEVRAEAAGVVSIVVEGQHLDELQAEPGQFFRWRLLTPDHWLNAHPFSLSAPPDGHDAAPDGQGAGRRDPHPPEPPGRDVGDHRRTVRCGDFRPPDQAQRPPDRQRSRHHADARTVREPPAEPGGGPAAVPGAYPGRRALPRRARRHRGPAGRAGGVRPRRRPGVAVGRRTPASAARPG